MKILRTFLIASGISMLITACEDDPVSDPVTQTPEVEFDIHSPAQGAMYSLGDTVHMHGSISYTPGLHGYSIELRNVSSGSVEFTMDEHAHDSMIHFQAMWVNNVTSHSDMMMIASAAIDHEGTLERDTVHFHCHPM